jgi:hypothetical protein
MASGALPFGVAARTEIAFGRRMHSMFAEPIPFVHQVAGGRRVFGGEIDMASVAVAEGPLIFVCVASEAGGHLWKQCVGRRFADSGVAANAIAVGRTDMGRMFEP